MNKKYATVEDFNELKAMLSKLIEATAQPKAEPKTIKQPKAVKGKSKKAEPKAQKGEFDRSLYEATAKKLGCFAYGKVVATVVDGKVVRKAQENRQLVYKAMGYTK